ncbi:MAG: hypothetical protein WCR46_23615, partial [Deltaproteobacteria bacterium]
MQKVRCFPGQSSLPLFNHKILNMPEETSVSACPWLRFLHFEVTMKKIILISVLLFLSVVFPVKANADLPTEQCHSIFSGWDKTCLTQKLRIYFNITPENLSDDKLQTYVERNTQNIVAQLEMIDYGINVSNFLNGNTNSIEGDNQSIEQIQKAWVVQDFLLTAIKDILLYIIDNAELNAISSAQSVFSTIFNGYEAYKAATVVLTAKETRFLLGVYCQDRVSGMSVDAAWQDVNDPAYSNLWDLITNLTNISKDILKLKFEYAYSMYRFVGYTDSYNIRTNMGNAIVAIVAPSVPVISQSPTSGPPGTTFSESGTGFLGNGKATLHFRKPDGTEYPTQTIDTYSDGKFSINYTAPPNKEPGVYTWWAIDRSTGVKSNDISYEITAPTFGPTIGQSPIAGPPGTTFTEWGYGFTPDHDVTLHFRKPDGTEYATQTVHTSSAGYFSISYTAPSNKAPGTYTWWAVDDHTGTPSSLVSYQILENSPQTVYIGGGPIFSSDTWHSGWTYIVQGNVTISQEAALTIEPGVEVKLGGSITINVSGTLTATGVKFTAQDQASPWDGLYFNGSGSSGSKLENCIIEYTAFAGCDYQQCY